MPGRRIPPELCVRCKGYKRLCGLPTCPILTRFRAQVLAASFGQDIEGDTPPSLVVGEEGYPRVSVLYQVPPGAYGVDAKMHDDPVSWFSRRIKLEEIIELRSKLVGAVLRVNVRNPWQLYEREVSVAAVSEKPVESSVELAKKPVPRLVFDGLTAPRGPAAPAKRLAVEGDPKPPKKLEKLFFDDVDARTGVVEAYASGVDYYLLIRAFAAGLLGRLRDRRLVPTRWAITAVDSIVGGWLRSRIAGYREVSEARLYKLYYLGNRFLVALLPGGPRVTMVEIWHPSTPWVRGAKPVAVLVYERPSGEPSSMDGGYMAARLAVYEALEEMRIRAHVLVIREVLPEYYAPVGNWHIRETLRSLTKAKPIEKGDTQTIIEAIVKHVEAKDAARTMFARLSPMLRQKQLDEWFAARGSTAK